MRFCPASRWTLGFCNNVGRKLALALISSLTGSSSFRIRPVLGVEEDGEDVFYFGGDGTGAAGFGVDENPIGLGPRYEQVVARANQLIFAQGSDFANV
jgi:hypothetical protein